MNLTLMAPRPHALLLHCAGIIACAIAPSALADDSNAALGLTIYSSAQPGAIAPESYRDGIADHPVPGYALIKQEREVLLSKGRNSVRFSDVAAQIDPTTVSFASLTDPENTRVVEQNFQFDLVSTAKLLEKYLDKEITVEQQRGNGVETFNGTLTSKAGEMVLKSADGSVRILTNYSGVKLPNLPGGLISKPTLVWEVTAQKAGNHRTRVVYQSAGITWWADYNFTVSEGSTGNACRLDAAAWVSILNRSGATYPDARLKLVAGDVQRAQPAAAPQIMGKMRSEAMAADASQGFQEKSFFEYHLYTLNLPTTLPDNSTKQLELFPTAHAVPCEKTLIYSGLGQNYPVYGSPMLERNFGVYSNKKVDVYLSFRNAKENRMGMPLPAGRVRVAKLDPADQSLEFIGEDLIDHTPKDEKVLLKLGSAFDVVGERRQVDFKIDSSKKTIEEEIEIRVRNQKEEPVTVLIRESLYRWINWEIVRKTHNYDKRDARSIEFPVKIDKGGEAVVRYAVRYTW